MGQITGAELYILLMSCLKFLRISSIPEEVSIMYMHISFKACTLASLTHCVQVYLLGCKSVWHTLTSASASLIKFSHSVCTFYYVLCLLTLVSVFNESHCLVLIYQKQIFLPLP